MGAVRTTQRQKFVDKRARRYHNYKLFIRTYARKELKPIPTGQPVIVDKVIFHMAIPKSWSGKKQREAVGQPHIKKPDIDNLIKGLFDALNGIAWADDNQVYKISSIEKIYSEKPGIEFSLLT